MCALNLSDKYIIYIILVSPKNTSLCWDRQRTKGYLYIHFTCEHMLTMWTKIVVENQDRSTAHIFHGGEWTECCSIIRWRLPLAQQGLHFYDLHCVYLFGTLGCIGLMLLFSTISAFQNIFVFCSIKYRYKNLLQEALLSNFMIKMNWRILSRYILLCTRKKLRSE